MYLIISSPSQIYCLKKLQLTFPLHELGVFLLEPLHLRLPLHLEPLLPVPVHLVPTGPFPAVNGPGQRQQHQQYQSGAHRQGHRYTRVVSLHDTVRITPIFCLISSTLLFLKQQPRARIASTAHDFFEWTLLGIQTQSHETKRWGNKPFRLIRTLTFFRNKYHELFTYFGAFQHLCAHIQKRTHVHWVSRRLT